MIIIATERATTTGRRGVKFNFQSCERRRYLVTFPFAARSTLDFSRSLAIPLVIVCCAAVGKGEEEEQEKKFSFKQEQEKKKRTKSID
jgi:hypothetical protein